MKLFKRPKLLGDPKSFLLGSPQSRAANSDRLCRSAHGDARDQVRSPRSPDSIDQAVHLSQDRIGELCYFVSK